MKIILKYPLVIGQDNYISTSKGAEILCVKLQDGVPNVWMLVDNVSLSNVSRIIKVVGTGWDLGFNTDKYIGTFLSTDEFFVWHAFDLGEVVNA